MSAIFRLLSLTLLLTGPATGQIQNFDERLDRLEQLEYSGTPAEVERRIERLAAFIETASPAQKNRFTLLRARAAAVTRRNDHAMALLERLLAERDGLRPETELRALTLAANLFIVSDQFEPGFQYFREALALVSRVQDPEARAGIYSVAAGFHARIGESGTAAEYANKAIAEVDRASAPRMHCIALERRARARLAMEETDAAMRDFREATKLCDSVPDRVFGGTVRVGLGRALRARGELEAAQALLATAIEHLAGTGFIDGELEARTLLADLLLDVGRIDQARQVMEPAMRRLDEGRSHAVRASAMNVQARLADAAGDRTRVYENTRRAIELEQRHSERIRHMRFTMLMSAYDDSAREAEVELLRSRNALAELDRESTRQDELALTYGGFGAAAAAILLTGLLIKTSRERRRLQQLSQHDGLTGLLNHTRFFKLAQDAFQRARQNATPFSLVVADVDLFKQVNDQYGHLVGDAVLARVGARLRAAFGSDAIIGRLGGEEFGVALVDSDTDSAVARIEHLRATLNRQRADDQEPAITMSFGVAELNREPTLDVLYAHADQALYDAKDAGRNRVITVARIDLGGAGFQS